MVLRSVGVLSAGKVMGAMGLIIGLIPGFFMGMMAVVAAIGVAADGGNQPLLPALGMAVASFFLLPLFYGAISFVMGIIYAFLYNLLAGTVGGLEMNFERAADYAATT